MIGDFSALAILLPLFALILYTHRYVLWEQSRLRDKRYADAVKEWERLQSWYVREHPDFDFPVKFFLESGSVVVVRIDSDGKLVLPFGLSQTELAEVTAVLKLRLGFPFDG